MFQPIDYFYLIGSLVLLALIVIFLIVFLIIVPRNGYHGSNVFPYTADPKPAISAKEDKKAVQVAKRILTTGK